MQTLDLESSEKTAHPRERWQNHMYRHSKPWSADSLLAMGKKRERKTPKYRDQLFLSGRTRDLTYKQYKSVTQQKCRQIDTQSAKYIKYQSLLAPRLHDWSDGESFRTTYSCFVQLSLCFVFYDHQFKWITDVRTVYKWKKELLDPRRAVLFIQKIYTYTYLY